MRDAVTTLRLEAKGFVKSGDGVILACGHYIVVLVVATEEESSIHS